MVSVTKLMPRPLQLAWEFTKPFALIPGGFALFLALLYLVIGQDPVPSVSNFLVGSTAALLPLAGILCVLWLYYIVGRGMLSANASDQWIVTQILDQLARLLRRLHYCLLLSSSLLVCIVPTPSLARLSSPYLPVRLVAGWRAGDSAQLE